MEESDSLEARIKIQEKITVHNLHVLCSVCYRQEVWLKAPPCRGTLCGATFF